MSARRAAIIAILVGAGVGAGVAPSARAAPRGTYVLVPATEPPVVAPAPISNIIFLNRCAGGCSFTQGMVSSSTGNVTFLGGGSNGEIYALPEFAYGDAVWDEIVACVREIYAPYDVVVTDVDPGTTTLHHEGVVAGGLADSIGVNPQFGGIAPLWDDCRLLENTVSFTFAGVYGPQAQQICATVAQETGHSFGLEHSFNCADPMTYLPACGLQFFRDGLEPCGEFAERPCMCGGDFLQDVHARLDAVFGPNATPLPAPEVTIPTPAPDAAVIDGFAIGVSATCRRGIGRLELWLNGWRWTTVEPMPGQTAFVLNAPAGLPDGIIDVEIRAYNDLQNAVGTRAITVTKGAPCANADACAPGQRCDGGRCLWDPAVGELGDACAYPQYCTSGFCEDGACADPCIAVGTGGCPSGYECVAEDGTTDGLCLATASGCCSTADRSPGGLLAQALLAGLVLGVTLSRRRRRR